uniref:Uncharacterized protein n=1 Tax=viral metagenome TaxID=1070528 RepID=A0A6M3JYQ2_9ZZZZ
MRIIATVTDAGGVVNAGASIESRSAIIEIPDNAVPEIIKRYFASEKWASEGANRYTYKYLTFSLLEANNERP